MSRINEDSIVVTNFNVLSEGYFPKDITSREFQVEELLGCLRPAYKKQKPIHSWMFGPPGSGKTLVSKFILKKIEKEAYVKGVYINCWEYNSYYSVLDFLVRELRVLGAEKLNTSFKLERFRQYMGNKPFLIVLDEIDHIKESERDSIIYNLCNTGNIGLICISNSRDALCEVDDRIKSRLNAKQIEFEPYTGMELLGVLSQRTQFALRPDSCKENALRIIAHYSEGDARAAIQVLKNASFFAEKELRKTVELKDIKAGYSSTKGLEKTLFLLILSKIMQKKQRFEKTSLTCEKGHAVQEGGVADPFLDKQSSHHRLLYELVKKRKEINSGELWKVYLSECKRVKKQPIALRTYSEYMNRLIELGLVQWDRALVRGKVRVFKISLKA